jgi:hypothetical protein
VVITDVDTDNAILENPAVEDNGGLESLIIQSYKS